MLKINYTIENRTIPDCIVKIIGINTKRVMNDLFVHPTVVLYPNLECANLDIGVLKVYSDIPSFAYKVDEPIAWSDLYVKLKTLDQFLEARDIFN